ncbi:MAG TPA: hypothetical protein VHD83_11680 [Puia sp.]|nr:hypothetical protein [Puia sp.]
MRNFAAILLGGILFFNAVGYRALTSIMQYRSGRQLELKLDKLQYDESQLTSIKIPVTHLAYYQNSASFERVNGEMEINGVPYKYVKRRIYNDSLELLCIPDRMLVKLRALGNGAFKLVHGIASFMADPYTITSCIQIEGPAYTLVVQGHAYMAPICPSSLPADEKPPARPV